MWASAVASGVKPADSPESYVTCTRSLPTSTSSASRHMPCTWKQRNIASKLEVKTLLNGSGAISRLMCVILYYFTRQPACTPYDRPSAPHPLGLRSELTECHDGFTEYCYQ